MISLVVLLSCSVRSSTLQGFVIVAGLIILGSGNGLLMEMSTISLSFRGVGVDVIVCDVTAWIGALGHMLLVGGTGVVLVGLFACMRCVVRVACWTACCILLRRLVISFRTLLPS